MSLSERVRRLEGACSPAGEGWQLDESWRTDRRAVELEGDGPWAKLKRIRDANPELRNKSLMDMAEDLIPGFKKWVREGAAAYEASHEWRWMNGRCYVRERPGLRGVT